MHPPWFGEGIPGPVTIDVFHVAHPDADHVVHPGAHRDSEPRTRTVARSARVACSRIRLDRTLFTATQASADSGSCWTPSARTAIARRAGSRAEPTFPGCLIRSRPIGIFDFGIPG